MHYINRRRNRISDGFAVMADGIVTHAESLGCAFERVAFCCDTSQSALSEQKGLCSVEQVRRAESTLLAHRKENPMIKTDEIQTQRTMK